MRSFYILLFCGWITYFLTGMNDIGRNGYILATLFFAAAVFNMAIRVGKANRE